ncbi:hypothetical protein RF11_15372 [Thelohanellus kitauei]|uniref:Uncharacterized protein n=1 Tax=Thelohanellus kitauei TaxID=669202 RepID=A0A0C2LZU0_THEKT|nr:hypothetical protein RF11_15372 [Thelohanellus kitauei]
MIWNKVSPHFPRDRSIYGCKKPWTVCHEITKKLSYPETVINMMKVEHGVLFFSSEASKKIWVLGNLDENTTTWDFDETDIKDIFIEPKKKRSLYIIKATW